VVVVTLAVLHADPVLQPTVPQGVVLRLGRRRRDGVALKVMVTAETAGAQGSEACSCGILLGLSLVPTTFLLFDCSAGISSSSFTFSSVEGLRLLLRFV
jgi:hypothetical protein